MNFESNVTELDDDVWANGYWMSSLLTSVKRGNFWGIQKNSTTAWSAFTIRMFFSSAVLDMIIETVIIETVVSSVVLLNQVMLPASCSAHILP